MNEGLRPYVSNIQEPSFSVPALSNLFLATTEIYVTQQMAQLLSCKKAF